MENIWSTPNIIDERYLHPFNSFITVLFLLSLLISTILFCCIPIPQHTFIIGERIESKDSIKIQFLITPKQLSRIENKTLIIDKKTYTYNITDLVYVSEKQILVEINLQKNLSSEIVKMHFWGRKQTLFEKVVARV